MSEIGDFIKAVDAVFEVHEYEAAKRMMFDFWRRKLVGRKHCMRCGQRRRPNHDLRPFAVTYKKAVSTAPTQVAGAQVEAFVTEQQAFVFCSPCARHMAKIVNDNVRVKWEQRVYAPTTGYVPPPKPWKSQAAKRKRARQRKSRPRRAR